jgi:hypothetical protein
MSYLVGQPLCNRFHKTKVRSTKSSGKLPVLKLVTSHKTFVPCVEEKKSARVANETYLVRVQNMKAMKSDVDVQSTVSAGIRQEVRCAVRFPLALPVVLNIDKAEFRAQTRNVSASGVLFAVDRELKVGSDIRFSMRMPGPVLGAAHDILVHCTGRVVRCSLSQQQYFAASTIDDYRFADN